MTLTVRWVSDNFCMEHATDKDIFVCALPYSAGGSKNGRQLFKRFSEKHAMKNHVILASLVAISLYLFFLPGNAQCEDGYLGLQVCKVCHDDRYESYMRSVHAKKAIPGTPINEKNCESCHGPGAEHVKKGGGKTGIFAFTRSVESRKRSERCLACHEETQSVAFWDISTHGVAGVSCDQCHSPHTGLEHSLKARLPDLCFACHMDIRSRFNRQSHHPVIEGQMTCTQCHNPMGSTFGKYMLRADSINELCYTCHAQRRGPFMWDHPPVAENCLNCHTPHGSNHLKLLQRNPPLLCQSCHDVLGHPGDMYTRFNTFKGPDTLNRMVARSCLNCHTNIHGSNGPSARGSHFLR